MSQALPPAAIKGPSGSISLGSSKMKLSANNKPAFVTVAKNLFKGISKNNRATQRQKFR